MKAQLADLARLSFPVYWDAVYNFRSVIYVVKEQGCKSKMFRRKHIAKSMTNKIYMHIKHLSYLLTSLFIEKLCIGCWPFDRTVICGYRYMTCTLQSQDVQRVNEGRFVKFTCTLWNYLNCICVSIFTIGNCKRVKRKSKGIKKIKKDKHVTYILELEDET